MHLGLLHSPTRNALLGHHANPRGTPPQPLHPTRVARQAPPGIREPARFGRRLGRGGLRRARTATAAPYSARLDEPDQRSHLVRTRARTGRPAWSRPAAACGSTSTTASSLRWPPPPHFTPEGLLLGPGSDVHRHFTAHQVPPRAGSAVHSSRLTTPKRKKGCPT